jgi:arsenate reductase
MNIQIFGAKKCFDTQKAERYFKERKIKYQYVDILKFGFSKGEFESVKCTVGLAGMINVGCNEYVALNMDKIRTEGVRAEILFNNPKLYKTPIIRNGKKATVGYMPDVWKEWE